MLVVFSPIFWRTPKNLRLLFCSSFNSTSKEEVPPFISVTVPDQQEVNESLECDLIGEMRENMNLVTKS